MNARALVASVALAATTTLVAPQAAQADQKPVLDDGFSHSARAGTVAKKYQKSLWTGAAFGNAKGRYSDKNISVHGGVLDVTLRKGQGGYVAFDPTGKGQTYGRYRVTFKVTGKGAGYGAALLLWPKSDKARDGELDLMEGRLNSTVKVFHHTMTCVPITAKKDPGYCGNQNQVDSGTRFADGRWHHIDTTWTKTSVTYTLDGKVLMRVTRSVPKTPHALILQIAKEGKRSTKVTHFLVDSVRIDPV